MTHILMIIIILSALAVGLTIAVTSTTIIEWIASVSTLVEHLICGVTVVLGATDVHTTTIGSNTYAVVVSDLDQGIQIINITNPEMPMPVSSLTDDETLVLYGATDVHTTTIGSNTYAVVASSNTYAVVASDLDQGIQIINITNPETLTPVSNLTDNSMLVLDGAINVHTTTIGSNTYAVVASYLDHGIQIINITNPEMPTPVSSVIDDETLVLETAMAVHTTTIGSNTYAVVASYRDDGIQIINITNPEMPTPVSSLTDDETLVLSGAKDVHTTTIGSNTYAVVVSNYLDSGMQIINITNPETPIPVSSVIDDETLVLSGAAAVHTTTIGSNTYAVVVSDLDSGMQIINITNPETPIPVSSLVNDRMLVLYSAESVHTTTIDSNTYALVASYREKGIQIINITNPETPIPVSSISKENIWVCLIDRFVQMYRVIFSSYLLYFYL